MTITRRKSGDPALQELRNQILFQGIALTTLSLLQLGEILRCL
jgi:hypothetical protein